MNTHEQRFIHVEPCPFYTKQYCLMDECIHGSLLGAVCDQCEGSSPVPLFGAERCHAAPCNCWKSAALKGEA